MREPVKLYSVEEARAAIAGAAQKSSGKRKPPKPKEKKRQPTAAEKKARIATMVGGAVLVDCLIPGEPKAWTRVRVNHESGAFFNSDELTDWEEMAALTMRQSANGLGAFGQSIGPVKVTMLAIYARTQAMDKTSSGYPVHRTFCMAHNGDLDNCLKSVNDALQKSNVIADDCQVVIVQGSCLYAAKGESPGVFVRVETLFPHEEPPGLGFGDGK